MDGFSGSASEAGSGGLVLLFALLHVINYELGAMDAGEWLRVLLKEAVKIPSALMFALRPGSDTDSRSPSCCISSSICRLSCSARWPDVQFALEKMHVRRFVAPAGQNSPPGTFGTFRAWCRAWRWAVDRIEDRGGGRNARLAGTEYP